jgi:hypothetical protein
LRGRITLLDLFPDLVAVLGQLGFLLVKQRNRMLHSQGRATLRALVTSNTTHRDFGSLLADFVGLSEHQHKV